MKLMNEIKLKCDPGNILKTRDRKQNLLIFTLAPLDPEGEKERKRKGEESFKTESTPLSSLYGT